MVVESQLLVMLPTKSNKLLLQWREPYVTERTVGSMFKTRRRRFVHANMHEPYFERGEQIQLVMQKPSQEHVDGSGGVREEELGVLGAVDLAVVDFDVEEDVEEG